MRLLSFDTSTQLLSLCLADDGKTVFEAVVEPREPGRLDTVSNLIPTIDRALKETGWGRGNLNAIAVNIGPGSFTGVRAGVVTARTLAQFLEVPLVGVSTFDCLRELLSEPAWVLLWAGKGGVYAQKYGISPGEGLDFAGDPIFAPTASLEEVFKNDERLLADEETFKQLSGRLKLSSLPEIKNMAVISAQIAWDRVSLKISGSNTARENLNSAFAWSAVKPLYLRRPSVTVKKENAS